MLLSPHNMSVYSLMCQCESGYIGHTLQKLECRIMQKVPFWIKNGHLHHTTTAIDTQISNSVIGQHLFDNPACANGHFKKF